MKILKLNDACTTEHCIRVTKYGFNFARYLNYTEKNIFILRNACILHDIGKLFIPKSILFKSSSLTESEYEIVKQHPVIAYEFLKNINSLNLEADIMLHHHEKVDGTGYPYGLKGSQISEFSKILTICDSFDAMLSNRTYNKVMNLEEAIGELDRNIGTQFDKVLTNRFIDFIRGNQQNCLNYGLFKTLIN